VHPRGPADSPERRQHLSATLGDHERILLAEQAEASKAEALAEVMDGEGWALALLEFACRPRGVAVALEVLLASAILGRETFRRCGLRQLPCPRLRSLGPPPSRNSKRPALSRR